MGTGPLALSLKDCFLPALPLSMLDHGPQQSGRRQSHQGLQVVCRHGLLLALCSPTLHVITMSVLD